MLIQRQVIRLCLRTLPVLAVLTAGPAEAAPIAFTALLSPANSPRPFAAGTIPGVAGQSIEISFLGIGGDADAGSGDSLFRALGGGLDFTWVAGQGTTAATHRLSPTAIVVGPTTSARGFSFLPVNYLAAPGASVDVIWLLHNDFDGRYAFGTDLLGTSFNDSAIPSSVRPWLQYEYVQDAPVPEPTSIVLVTSGLVGLGVRRWRKRGRPDSPPS
jgi:hypothetical protein